MSKIGKLPIKFDTSKVKVMVEKGGMYNNLTVAVEGPKGKLALDLRKGVNVIVEGDTITLTIKNDTAKALHGLYRSMIANMIEGTINGYEKKLEIHGVGYRGSQKGTGIELSLGFSHKVNYHPKEGVEVKMIDETNITVTGVDKQKVGQAAAEIRELRKPEPYKGKGIRYLNEQVRRKAGKSSAS